MAGRLQQKQKQLHQRPHPVAVAAADQLLQLLAVAAAKAPHREAAPVGLPEPLLPLCCPYPRLSAAAAAAAVPVHQRRLERAAAGAEADPRARAAAAAAMPPALQRLAAAAVRRVYPVPIQR